jgi:hypothetical protein
MLWRSVENEGGSIILEAYLRRRISHKTGVVKNGGNNLELRGDHAGDIK